MLAHLEQYIDTCGMCTYTTQVYTTMASIYRQHVNTNTHESIHRHCILRSHKHKIHMHTSLCSCMQAHIHTCLHGQIDCRYIGRQVDRQCMHVHMHIQQHMMCVGNSIIYMTQCGRCILEFPNRKKRLAHLLPWLCVFQELSSLRCLLPFSTHTLIGFLFPSSVPLSRNR